MCADRAPRDSRFAARRMRQAYHSRPIVAAALPGSSVVVAEADEAGMDALRMTGMRVGDLSGIERIVVINFELA